MNNNQYVSNTVFPFAANSIGSYITPQSDLTLAQRVTIREAVDQALVNAMAARSVRDQANQLVLRDTLPHDDLGVNDTSNSWLVHAAGVAGTLQDLVPQHALSSEQAIVFYGLALLGVNQTSPAAITEMAFIQQSGPKMLIAQTERLEALEEPVGYFSEFIQYTPGNKVQVQVMPITGGFNADTVRVIPLNRFIEPWGNTISYPAVNP